MPEVLEGEYLHELLDEVGCCSNYGYGAVGLNWQELLSWAKVSGFSLGYWDLRALKETSKAYADIIAQANGKDYPAPYEDDDNGEREVERATRSKSALERYVKNG